VRCKICNQVVRDPVVSDLCARHAKLIAILSDNNRFFSGRQLILLVRIAECRKRAVATKWHKFTRLRLLAKVLHGRR
jgi:hypothetical protein